MKLKLEYLLGHKYKLIKYYLLAISILAFYFWLNSGPEWKRMRDEFLLITGDKVVVKGSIINADEFQDEIEQNDSRTIKVVHGFSYTYTFRTLNGVKIVSTGYNYGELPAEKTLNEIPYQIEVEYLKGNPNINRIKDFWSNNTGIGEWFRHHVLFKLIGLGFCLLVCFIIIKNGILGYKAEENSQ